ncbi:MAG: DUF1501 domain-containing protein [Verrucomicrobia bacterium]|nr:DUF1501 domain-containing protein [Verrucomicrobiota bacterium]
MRAKLQAHISGNRDELRTLVIIFLRGGADGLNMVAPVQDAGYHKARPRIALKESGALRLDGFFALHPLLKELKPGFDSGQLGIVHAAGSEDSTRSHFEAQDLMEHGGIVAGGWLGRFLRCKTPAADGALSAIALGQQLPESLRGAPSVTVLRSLADFSFGRDARKFRLGLEKLYEGGQDALAAAGRDTLGALRKIEALRKTPYSPAHGAEYETGDYSRGLQQIAQLVKARVGLEAATLDLDGWDSHFQQGFVMDPRMMQLSRGLSAFMRDLGVMLETVSVVVMTEFGRRFFENSALGTDHGRGSVMFLAGGGVKGGRVYGTWPGLTDDVLEGPGDLPVTTNYRDVLAPILARHGAGAALSRIFPDHGLKPLGIYG